MRTVPFKQVPLDAGDAITTPLLYGLQRPTIGQHPNSMHLPRPKAKARSG